MKIAVLMSTYNGEKYICEQLDSILNQTGDFELNVIIRDDGSSDGTVDILREYEKTKRVLWYTGINLKPAKSFIQLVMDTSGYDFYAFADQDDYWYPDRIQVGLEAIKNISGPVIFFSNGELVDDKLRSLRRPIYRNMPPTDFPSIICGAGVQGCTMLFNESMASIIRNGKVPGQIVMHDSYLTRTCLSVNGILVYDNRPLIKYRQHGNNVFGISTNKKQVFKDRVESIFSKDEVSIAEEAKEIIDNFSSIIPDDKKKFLLRVAVYKQSFIRKMALSLSKRTRYITMNKSFEIRLKILLGNR